jgi:zinc D-Ala-D-Ala dipeptidase
MKLGQIFAPIAAFTCLITFWVWSKNAPPSARGAEIVNVKELIPELIVAAPYATEDNFFKTKFYPAQEAYLRRAVAEKLLRVQRKLQAQGMALKLWDGYRPLAVQKAMWKVMPNPDYVADPAKGSRHNRGAAVDVTLVDAAGKELVMPTKYDDFSPQAHRDAVVSEVAAKNRATLRSAMEAEGFTCLPTEWWHYDASGWEQFPIMDLNFTEITASKR